MSDISQDAREETIRGQMDEAALKKQKEELAQSAAVQNYELLKRLSQSEEWKFFLESELRPIVQDEHDAALDVKKSKDERDTAAQRHDFGNTLLNKLDERLKFWANKAGYTVLQKQ
jgi:hypothetical protein